MDDRRTWEKMIPYGHVMGPLSIFRGTFSHMFRGTFNHMIERNIHRKMPEERGTIPNVIKGL